MVVKTTSKWKQWSSTQGAMDEFCAYIASGGHMAGFCRDREFAYTTMLDWIANDKRRAEMYARAREDRSDLLADEIVAISDETEVIAKHDGEEVRLQLDAAAVARNRLRIDARKWIAAKLKPRTYGDKVELAGEVTMKRGVADLSDAELASIAAGKAQK